MTWEIRGSAICRGSAWHFNAVSMFFSRNGWRLSDIDAPTAIKERIFG
jgi:hypothetical protein